MQKVWLFYYVFFKCKCICTYVFRTTYTYLCTYFKQVMIKHNFLFIKFIHINYSSMTPNSQNLRNDLRYNYISWNYWYRVLILPASKLKCIGRSLNRSKLKKKNYEISKRYAKDFQYYDKIYYYDVPFYFDFTFYLRRLQLTEPLIDFQVVV